MSREPETLPFELHVALRYLVARRRQAFISLISFVSALGVTVGVTALIIALALMTGLQGELRDRMLGSQAHIFVYKPSESGIVDQAAAMRELRQVPGVTGAAPVVMGKALIRTGQADGFVTIKGIDPELESSVTDMGRRMRAGSLAALGRSGDGLDGIAIGNELARQLGVQVGDSVTLLTPEGTLSPMGLMPRSRTLQVVGIFSLGLLEFDSAYAVVSLPVAQRLVGHDHADYIQLRVADVYAAPRIADDIQHRFGGAYIAQDWADMNQSLFSALWLEKVALAITIGLIVMVAALNIIASLVLMVMEKSRDIAILKTMGASARSIMIVFMLQGLLIGAIGTFAGAVLGRGAALVLDRYKLVSIPMDVYQISYVPFRIETSDFLLVLGCALVICFVATIYPSRQAARLDPAEALRYG
jgi:lipoprotein-releasing system permease protein